MGRWGASGEPLDDDAREQVGEPLTGEVDLPEGQGHREPFAGGGVVSGSGRYVTGSDAGAGHQPERYEPLHGETRDGGSREVGPDGAPLLDADDAPLEVGSAGDEPAAESPDGSES